MPPMPPGPPRVAMLFEGNDGGTIMEDLIGSEDVIHIVTVRDSEMPESFEIEVIDTEMGEPR
jgi:hypothetical protein